MKKLYAFVLVSALGAVGFGDGLGAGGGLAALLTPKAAAQTGSAQTPGRNQAVIGSGQGVIGPGPTNVGPGRTTFSPGQTAVGPGQTLTGPGAAGLANPQAVSPAQGAGAAPGQTGSSFIGPVQTLPNGQPTTVGPGTFLAVPGGLNNPNVLNQPGATPNGTFPGTGTVPGVNVPGVNVPGVNLPGTAGQNLPGTAGQNVPGAAGQNLPGAAGQNLPAGSTPNAGAVPGTTGVGTLPLPPNGAVQQSQLNTPARAATPSTGAASRGR